MNRRDPTLHDPLFILHTDIELMALFMRFFIGSYIAMIFVSIALFTNSFFRGAMNIDSGLYF